MTVQLVVPLIMMLVAGLTALAPSQEPARMAAAHEVDRVVDRGMRERPVPGVAVAVLQSGRMLVEKGYGLANIEHNVPVQADSVFRIGSITKQFTAASILLLAQQGRLSLDDRLSKFFPQVHRADEVTIRNLLTHTSGIANYPDCVADPQWCNHDYTEAEVIDWYANRRFDFDPGTRHAYSNPNYYLLGAIVGRVSGQTLSAFWRDLIFQPLGLRHTTEDDPSRIVPKRVAGYMRGPLDSGIPFVNSFPISMSVVGGAALLMSTVGDLARWHQALLSGRVINTNLTATFDAFDAKQRGDVVTTGNADELYGFGLRASHLEGQRRIGHTGAVTGFHGALFTYPHHSLTIVVLMNLGPGGAPSPSRPATIMEQEIARALIPRQ